MPYGRRGNGVVRHLGESYGNVVLTAGFSKAYSSLLAFVACSSDLKQVLKVTAPPYLYSGPSPIASLASALVGLQVNATRGDQLRARIHAGARRILDHLAGMGVATRNVSAFPVVEVPLADPDDLDLLRDALDWLYTETETNRVDLDLFVENDRARRTYEKLGFIVEGRLRDYHRSVDGRIRDALIMSILRKDWAKRHRL